MLLVKWMQHHLMRTLGNWYNFSDFNLHVKFEFFRKAVTFTKSSEGLRQCTNLKSDSSGGGPHQPWRNVDSERGQVHLGCASVYLPPSSSTLRWSCTRCLNHWLRSNVDSEGGKYTSAIASVYLPPSSSTLRWSCTRRKASTPRLRLGVLAFLLVQLQLKSPSSKSKFTSAAPRWTWPWTRGTWAESVGGHLVQLQLKSPSSSPSSPRLRLGELGLDSGNLSEVRQVHIPPL